MKKRAAKAKAKAMQKAKARRGPLTEIEAAKKLQGMYRARAAKKLMRILARSVFERVLDVNSGAYFYHNLHTGDVSWEAPKILGNESFDEITDKTVSPHDAVTTYRSLARNWSTHEADGIVYYFDAATEETTWEQPIVLQRLQQAIEERDEMLGPDWQEVQDPNDGTYFFHNIKTNETQWDPPKVDFRKTKEEKEREALEEKKRLARLSKLQKRMSKKGNTLLDLNAGDSDDDKNGSMAESDHGDGDSDSESSGPPEALMVGEDGEIASDQDSMSSSDSESIYITSDEEEEDYLEQGENANEERINGDKNDSPNKISKRKRRKRERQRLHHMQVLAELAGASDRERGEFEAKVRIKRFRKKRQNRLNLSFLDLDHIPQALFENSRLIKRLNELVISGNRICKVSADIKKMRESLQELSLDSNELVKVPVQTWYLTNLRKLDLRNNRLRDISREKGNMTVLREMNIWEIGIETMQSLQELRLDNNLLSELPVHLSTLISLRVLTLRSNRLVDLAPKHMAQLENLVHLDIAENGLLNLPERVLSCCPLLQVVDLSENSMAYLPDDISKLTDLRVLRCAKNSLLQIPLQLARLAKLEHLDLNHNSLESLPQEWETKFLRTLNVSYNQLQSLPASLTIVSKDLERIYLRKNNMRARLPGSISSLEQLRVLDVGENSIDGLDNLPPNLRVGLFDHNKLRTIPGDVFFPVGAHLGRLSLADNSIRSISAPSNQLGEQTSSSRLRDLDLSGNDLTELPGGVFNRLSLRRLNLSRNQLTSLATELANSRNHLETLDLERNRIRELPAFLSDLPKLRYISLNHNLLIERPDFLAQNPKLFNWHVNFNPIEVQEDPFALRRALLNQAALFQAENKPLKALEMLNEIMDGLTDGQSIENLAISGNVIAKSVKEQREDAFLLEVVQKRAMTNLALERFAEAERDLCLAISRYDQPGAALLYYRGMARYKGLNDIRGALQDLDKSLKLRPRYAPAQRVRAQCLLQMGLFKAALEESSQALEFDMYDLDARLCKGMALEKLVDLDGALITFQEVVAQIMTPEESKETEEDQSRQTIAQISPWSPLGLAHYRWGLVLRDLARHGEAVIKFQDAADVLFVQYEKAHEGSLRKTKLGNWLHMALMCKASALQSANRAKKARVAYEEAQEFARQLHASEYLAQQQQAEQDVREGSPIAKEGNSAANQ